MECKFEDTLVSVLDNRKSGVRAEIADLGKRSSESLSIS